MATATLANGAHASRHALGGSDAVTLDKTQVSGLGDAAAKNTGTTAGTLAAGDDSRITGAVQTSSLTELVQDIVGAFLTSADTGNITISYNDAGNAMTINTATDFADLATVATTGDASSLGGSPLLAGLIPVGAVFIIGYNTGTSTWNADPDSSRLNVGRIYVGGDDAHPPSPPAGVTAPVIWFEA